MAKRYCEKKVAGYKEQDKAAGTAFSNENYVTVEWLMNAMKGVCSKCKNDFNITYEGGLMKTNFTADRPNNDEPHTLCNVVPMCIRCNCEKSNK